MAVIILNLLAAVSFASLGVRNVPGILGLALALCGVVLTVMYALAVGRARQSMAAQVADRIKLHNALDQMGNGNLSITPLEFATDDYESLGTALDRAVETTRTRISELEWSSDHDMLTGLFNSASFKRRCQAYLSSDDSGGLRAGTLLYIDINEFKQVNDSLGHEAGDKLLIACADRLKMAVAFDASGRMSAVAAAGTDEPAPMVGRLGGDEFAIFLPAIVEQAHVERAIQRIQRLINEPCHVNAHSLRTTASIGAALSADHHNVFERLLSAADTAMYEAKSAGKGGHRFYDDLMRNKADKILERKLELTAALGSGQFRLYFQPQMVIATGRIVGAEALIRWEHPQRGIILPNDFIPFAETYGLIDQIGDWVLHEAVKTAARWWHEGRRLRVSVNISPNQLNRIELIPTIRACLSKYKLPSEALEVEITEAAVMHNDPVALERLQSLRKDGVSLALDDFGTGYSNLSKLLAMPMDRLKLDSSLLWADDAHGRSWMVLKSIIQLSRRLGFEAVAEGVETDEQLAFLASSRCHLAQGYLIARPLPEAAFIAMVDGAGRSEKSAAVG